jgi:hypothetical protein
MRHFGALGVVVLLDVVVAVVAAALIMIPTLTLCTIDPLVPVIDSVNAPVEVVELALTVNVVVAVDPDGGVTGPGRLIVTPVGAEPNHEYVNETAELNPFIEPTVIVDVPLAP